MPLSCSDVGCSGQRSLSVRMAAKTNKPSIHYENIHIIGHLKVIPPPDPTNLGKFSMVTLKEDVSNNYDNLTDCVLYVIGTARL